MKSKPRKNPHAKGQENRRDNAEKALAFDAQPPTRRPWLLALSSLLIVAWIVFLALMAFRQ